MDRGFYIILAAQFLSALADSALQIAAMSMLKLQHTPEWHNSMLVWGFTVSYVLLAPFVGSFADSMHKGHAMLLCNAIKLSGCVAMLIGLPPVLAYTVVGFGAAAYSPAKYGIVTEYLPHDKLVAANGWLEGSTVAAIIFGIVLGGALVGTNTAAWLAHSPLAMLSPPVFGLIVISLVYIAASWINLYVPKLDIELKPIHYAPGFLLREFWDCVIRLWKDPQGQLSLAVTTILWGAGRTMQLVVINWAIIWLGFNFEHATQLVAVFAFGTAFGAVIAGQQIPLKQAFRVLPAGIVMGLLMIGLLFVHDPAIAALQIFLIGSLAGFFVVPLNAMLQHRGHLLMGAGHSIAVQNFNENLGILIMVGIHAMLVRWLSGPITDTMPGSALAYFQQSGGIPPMRLIIISFASAMILVMLYIIRRYHAGEAADLMHD
ncbi:MAG: lysophospholipid transporter LplT [Burkholderiales bacterium]|nr:lysophospholipid transporter LplT [Burkholderiales bacterium]